MTNGNSPQGSRNSGRGTAASQASSSVTRNTSWNLVGTGLPILLTAVAVPALIHNLGTVRFGVFTIAWVLVGYFGLFDLGLGRAATNFLAQSFEQGRVLETRAIFWTSLALSGLLGVFGAAVLAGLSPLLVRGVLNIPAEIQAETLTAFYLLACCVPLLTTTTTLRGTLEARHRFVLLNVLQIPIGTLTQAAPLLALLFSDDLAFLVGSLVLSRLVGLIVFFVAGVLQISSPFEGPFFLRGLLGPLLTYGGWLTITNVLGPLMVYADRFFIGAFSSMTAVAYYTTPYEAITRLWILPYSLSRTVFPIFSTVTDKHERSRLYTRAVVHLILVLAPIVALVVVFAPELLRLWIGDAFAANSTTVLQILAVGVFINSLAQIPYTLIQGLGRPDITAKFHLLELPFYLVLLYFGVRYWGADGAAAAWTARVGLDAALLALYVRLKGYVNSSVERGRTLSALLLALPLICGGWLLYASSPYTAFKAEFMGFLIAVECCIAWRYLLESCERKRLVNFVGAPVRKVVRLLIFKNKGRKARR